MNIHYLLGHTSIINLYLRKDETWAMRSPSLPIALQSDSLEPLLQEFSQKMLENEAELQDFLQNKRRELSKTRKRGVCILYGTLEMYEIDENICLVLQNELDFDRKVIGFKSLEMDRQVLDTTINLIKDLPSFPMETTGLDDTFRDLIVRHGISNTHTFSWWSGCERENNAFGRLARHFNEIYDKIAVFSRQEKT
jgi:hypothetical protein